MQYKNISASAQVKSGTGSVHGVIVNSHTSGTLRLNDGLSGTTSAGVKATGVFTASDVFTAGETVLIGDKTYTFVSALTGVANEVLIGASTAAALDNLKSAINATAGAGTTYGTGTAANPNVTATTNTDTAQTVEAYTVGTAGNSIATTTDCENSAWGAATLENGAQASVLITNTYTFPAGSGVYEFPAPIDFSAGLYATIGGTADLTIVYN